MRSLFEQFKAIITIIFVDVDPQNENERTYSSEEFDPVSNWLLEVDTEMLRKQTNNSHCVEPSDVITCSNVQVTDDTKHTSALNNDVAQSNSKIQILSDIKIGSLPYPNISYEMGTVHSFSNNLIVVPPKEQVTNMPIPDNPLIIMDYDSSISNLNCFESDSKFNAWKEQGNLYSSISNKDTNSTTCGPVPSTDPQNDTEYYQNDLESPTNILKDSTYSQEDSSDSPGDFGDENTTNIEVTVEIISRLRLFSVFTNCFCSTAAGQVFVAD